MIMQQHKTVPLHTALEKHVEDIRSALIPVDSVSPEKSKEIIQRYVAAIEGNFVPWFCAVTIHARSPQAKYAAMENLDVEIRDDHQGMLRTFAAGAKAEPIPEHYHAMLPHVLEIRKLIAEGSGLKSITICACLEYFSKEFIPYLAELAKKCHATNFQYTDVHGEADIVHASQGMWAVEHEAKWGYEKSDADIEKTIIATKKFIKSIFSV